MNRCYNTYSRNLDITSLHFLPVLINNPKTGEEVKVNAMIDSGADRHSLDSKVAKRLRLEGQEMSFAVTGSGGIVTNYTNAMNTRVIVKNCEDPTTFWDIEVQCFPNPAGRIIPPNWHALRKDFRHLRDVPVPECRPEPVSLIIGNDNPQLQISLQDVEGNSLQPCAREYRLGWTVFGPTRIKSARNCFVTMAEPIRNSLPSDLNLGFDAQYLKEAFRQTLGY